MTENTDNFVDVNTDDLDLFTNLMNGNAKPLEEKEDEPKAQEDIDAPDSDEEDSLATEETDDDEPEESDEDEQEEEDTKLKLGKKPKKSFQERINELRAKAGEAERLAAELKRENEALKASKDEIKTDLKKVAETADDAPNPDATGDNGEPLYPLGEFDPRFIRDLTKYTIAKESEAARQVEAERRAEEAQQQALQELSTAWQEKLSVAEEEFPDIREKGQNLEETFSSLDPSYGQYLASTIMSLDYGPQVLYYLSTNLDEARKIVASGPTQATIALGRIEAKFLVEQEKATMKPKVSKAPEPPAITTRGKATRVDIPDDTDDLDAFSDKFFVKKKR